MATVTQLVDVENAQWKVKEKGVAVIGFAPLSVVETFCVIVSSLTALGMVMEGVLILFNKGRLLSM